jgi:hypothetical protein
MMKIKFYALLICFTITSQVWAAAWDQSMPLESSKQQAEAFLKIRSLIPSMSAGAARYSFNPVQLLENQAKIENMMAADPTYAKLKRAHRDLVTFTVLAGAQDSRDTSDKADNWNKWIQSSTEVARKAGVNSQASVVQKIQELIASPWLGKSQGIVVGLAQLLPNELKKDFFALPLAAKVEMLEKNLPAEVVSQGFAPARLGWNDAEISKAEIINRLKASVQTEQVFTALLVYHYSLLQGELATPKDYLAKWHLEGSAKKTLEQAFNSQVSKLVPTEQKAAEVALVLREISPVVGMFRGFAGNDCSTLRSFPFVNSPNEFTFLVYDGKGGIKGYAQGTKIFTNNRPAFYLHTIVGPRISGEDSFNILRVLNQEKGNMGWSEILLPSLEKIGGLVNSVAVREVLKEVISAEKVPLYYQDAELRKNLKTAFNIFKTYDDADENKEGYRMATARLGSAIPVNRTQSLGLEKVDSRIDKNELIGMLLQLGKDIETNRPMIDALVAHAGLNSESVQILIRKMFNYSQYPAPHFIADFAENLKKEGFAFKEGYFQKNLSLVAVGLLRSPDLKTDRKLVQATLEALYDQHDITRAEDFLKKNKTLYTDKKISDAFFRAYYNDVHEADLQASEALKIALEMRPQNILADPELLSFIMISEQGRNVLRDFLIERPLMSRGLEASVPGRKLIDIRNQFRNKMNIVLAELLKADSEREFVRILETRVGEVFKMGMLERMDLSSKLMAMSLTHYLSLKPSKSLYIPRSNFGEKGYERDLRRIMPALLKAESPEGLEANLRWFYGKSGGAQLLETMEPAIRAGLRQRPDLLTMNIESFEHLPKWKPLLQLRCEMLF